jgi:hypothetical protein
VDPERLDDTGKLQWASGVLVMDRDLMPGLGNALRGVMGEKALPATLDGAPGTFVVGDIVRDARGTLPESTGKVGSIGRKLELGSVVVLGGLGAVVVGALGAAAAGIPVLVGAVAIDAVAIAALGTLAAGFIGSVVKDFAPKKALEEAPEGSVPKAVDVGGLAREVAASLGVPDMVDVAGKLASRSRPSQGVDASAPKLG